MQAEQQRHQPTGAGAILLLAAMVCASFWLFPAWYPTLQGDGEFGGSPRPNLEGITRPHFDYPENNARLPSFVNDVLARLTNGHPYRNLPFTHLDHNPAINGSWMLLCLLTGTILVLALGRGFARSRTGTPCSRLALFTLVVTSPPMLNAYGHFDSYILPVALVAAWGFFLTRHATDKNETTTPFLESLAGVFALWAHPVCGIALAGTLFYWVVRHRPAFSTVALPAGVAMGLLPLAVPGFGNSDLLNLATDPMWPQHLASRLVPAALAVIPIIFLVPAALRADRNRNDPLRSTALFILTAALLLLFTINAGLGLGDELLLSIPGAFVLWAIIGLGRTADLPLKSLQRVALFSVLLFAARVAVNSSPALFDLYLWYAPHDHCQKHRVVSPHATLGLHVPITSEADRDRRLAVFKAGIESTHPQWRHFQSLNLQYYTAWCFELGREEEGRKALLWALQFNPELLPELWRRGCFFTWRAHDTAWQKIRAESALLIESNLREHPEDPVLKGLSAALAGTPHSEPSGRSTTNRQE